MKSADELEVFKKAHRLTLELYQHTDAFPQTEKFGLVSQIRRACSSICANLMEGSHRINTGEFRQFVGIANGSVGELKYHILLAKDLGYVDIHTYQRFVLELDTISKMLRGLIRSLTNTNTNTNTSTNTPSQGAS